jgi:hypothetical protein
MLACTCVGASVCMYYSSSMCGGVRVPVCQVGYEELACHSEVSVCEQWTPLTAVSRGSICHKPLDLSFF